jgi:hypothetical protein
MSRRRILAALGLLVVLAGLLAWQQQRARLVRACQEEFGIWDGATCRPDERRIRIQRDLQRT